MERLSLSEYGLLIEGAEIIEQDGFGLKVLETNEGEMIKLFRRKRFFSTALLKPYAVRFVDNAKKLKSLGIHTITINKLYWCSQIKRHIVVYERLEGELLRDALTQASYNIGESFQKFGEFISELHEKGVFFRSAHLKNILVLPNKEFGLIDISDMQIKRHSLNMNLRLRNFEHILRYQDDKNLLRHHLSSFVASYVSASHLNEKKARQIGQGIQSILI